MASAPVSGQSVAVFTTAIAAVVLLDINSRFYATDADALSGCLCARGCTYAWMQYSLLEESCLAFCKPWCMLYAVLSMVSNGIWNTILVLSVAQGTVMAVMCTLCGLSLRAKFIDEEGRLLHLRHVVVMACCGLLAGPVMLLLAFSMWARERSKQPTVVCGRAFPICKTGKCVHLAQGDFLPEKQTLTIPAMPLSDEEMELQKVLVLDIRNDTFVCHPKVLITKNGASPQEVLSLPNESYACFSYRGSGRDTSHGSWPFDTAAHAADVAFTRFKLRIWIDELCMARNNRGKADCIRAQYYLYRGAAIVMIGAPIDISERRGVYRRNQGTPRKIVWSQGSSDAPELGFAENFDVLDLLETAGMNNSLWCMQEIIAATELGIVDIKGHFVPHEVVYQGLCNATRDPWQTVHLARNESSVEVRLELALRLASMCNATGVRGKLEVLMCLLNAPDYTSDRNEQGMRRWLGQHIVSCDPRLLLLYGESDRAEAFSWLPMFENASEKAISFAFSLPPLPTYAEQLESGLNMKLQGEALQDCRPSSKKPKEGNTIINGHERPGWMTTKATHRWLVSTDGKNQIWLLTALDGDRHRKVGAYRTTRSWLFPSEKSYLITLGG